MKFSFKFSNLDPLHASKLVFVYLQRERKHERVFLAFVIRMRSMEWQHLISANAISAISGMKNMEHRRLLIYEKIHLHMISVRGISRGSFGFVIGMQGQTFAFCGCLEVETVTLCNMNWLACINKSAWGQHQVMTPLKGEGFKILFVTFY